MKRLFYLLLTGLFAQCIVSCYPGGADNVKDLDVAITNYDKNADFANYVTYTLPDSIVYFVDQGSRAMMSTGLDTVILNLVNQKFTDMGYQEIPNPTDSTSPKPDFVITVSAFSNTSYYFLNSNWYNNWGWYPGWDYWFGWNTSFGPWYPWHPVVYSYRSGSVVIEMLDTKNAVPDSKRIPVLWTGIADGILSGSSTSILNRAIQEINQCFAQSPYLDKTK